MSLFYPLLMNLLFIFTAMTSVMLSFNIPAAQGYESISMSEHPIVYSLDVFTTTHASTTINQQPCKQPPSVLT